MINRAILSLKLDENADIISYQEYHPFGTTSDKNGYDPPLKMYKGY